MLSLDKAWDSTCCGIFMQRDFWLVATRRDWATENGYSA